jgi:hypothetical protein
MQDHSFRNLTGYSANIELRLEVADRFVPLAQVGDTFVITREPADLPPGEATVVFSVDGVEHRRAVFLPDGMRPGNDRVVVHDRAPAAARG